MNADREPNRLPLRAGAMLLLAVAVVFIGLGWHSAVSGDNDPAADLAAAGSAASAASSSAAAQSSESATTSASANSPRVCVFNAGSVAGLAGEVSEELEGKGFRVAAPGNLSSTSITENTVFYDSGQQAAAEKVAEALGGEVSVESRPAAFTQCSRGLPVIVVTR